VSVEDCPALSWTAAKQVKRTIPISVSRRWKRFIVRLLFAAVFQSDPPPGNHSMANHCGLIPRSSLREIYFMFFFALFTRHPTLDIRLVSLDQLI
jgi:hypothetical protein